MRARRKARALPGLLRLLAALAAAAMTAAPVRAQGVTPTTPVETGILDHEAEVRRWYLADVARFNEAYRKKDGHLAHMTLDGITADFTFKQMDGRVVTRQQFEADLKRYQSGADEPPETMTDEVYFVRVDGDEATLYVGQHIAYGVTDREGRFGPAGEKRRMDQISIYRVLAVKTRDEGSLGDKWKIRSLETLDRRTTVNGKQIPRARPAATTADEKKPAAP